MFSRRKRGEPLLGRLNEVEVAVLIGLLDELDELAAGTATADPVSQRLMPDGYRDDPAAADDFRDLTQSALIRERRERYQACRDELPHGGGELALEPASAQRWLIVLNDMRLALGTRLGVTADGFADATVGADPANSQFAARTAYYWLTAVQDDLISQVTA